MCVSIVVPDAKRKPHQTDRPLTNVRGSRLAIQIPLALMVAAMGACKPTDLSAVSLVVQARVTIQI